MSRTMAEEEPETVADLLRRLQRLGDIPPERILLRPTPGKATEADLVRLQKNSDVLYELVEGTLIEKAMGYRESNIAGRLLGLINVYLDDHPLGFAAGGDGQLRLIQGLIRVPDVSFSRQERFADGYVPDQPIPDLVADLAVEVLSPSNTPGEMRRKLKEYFLSGTEAVWVIDPETFTVAVYTAPDARTVFVVGDTIDGGALLPGFSVTVGKIFQHVRPPGERPVRKKRKPKKS